MLRLMIVFLGLIGVAIGALAVPHVDRRQELSTLVGIAIASDPFAVSEAAIAAEDQRMTDEAATASAAGEATRAQLAVITNDKSGAKRQGWHAGALDPTSAVASLAGTLEAGMPLPVSVRALRLASAEARLATIANEAASMDRRTLVRAIQTDLKSRTCYRGRVDGLWGSGSRRAVNRFIDVTGAWPEGLDRTEPSPELLLQLRRSAEVACGRSKRADRSGARHTRVVATARGRLRPSQSSDVIGLTASSTQGLRARRTTNSSATRRKASVRRVTRQKAAVARTKQRRSARKTSARRKAAARRSVRSARRSSLGARKSRARRTTRRTVRRSRSGRVRALAFRAAQR